MSVAESYSVSGLQAARAQWLEHDAGLLLALYPAERAFEPDMLNTALGRQCQPATNLSIETFLERHQSGNIPLNRPGGLHILVDEALSEADRIVYESAHVEQPPLWLEMNALHPLISDEKIGVSFSSVNEANDGIEGETRTMKLGERMKLLQSLPPLPDTVAKLITLRNRYEVNADYLIGIIDKDPVLCAQIISYANSAFFGQAGTVTSLRDAIFRVLGVNAVVDLALGLSVGRVLHIPADGVLGAHRLWRHSAYSAALMQRLALLMPWGERPDIGSAYLAGLLHDIGFFILGYLFKEEHRALARLIESHPETPVCRLEYNLMGMSHCELGQMAMRLWEMPESITEVVRHHHDTRYEGEHTVLIHLLQLVESLLSSQGLTDTPAQDIDETLLKQLGLEEEDVILAADEVIQSGATLEKLAGQMCA